MSTHRPAYRLEVANISNQRPSLFVTIRGSAEEVRRRSVEVLRNAAERFGVSPLALDWSLTAHGANA